MVKEKDKSLSRLLEHRPKSRRELKKWVKTYLGITIPDKAICPSHNAPLDYLAASFLEENSDTTRDFLIWANRGGGKTMLAAIASLLDAIYKAPINIRILGGSFDQSDRLADYLRQFLSRDLLKDLLEGKMTRQRIHLITGADIRMLSQSQRAVRGLHVEKIRCDEVDLFDPEVWSALQFTTRSSDRARAGIEVFSTLHRPGGLMEKLVSKAIEKKAFKLFKWCIWEVIEKCPASRQCENCPLLDDCQGKAKKAKGFFRIDDAIAIKARSSKASWQAEMLCLGPKRDWCVFDQFDPAVHVAEVKYCPDWPLYRAIDFGYTAPLVCLWIQVSPDGVVHVIDEYARVRLAISQHAVEILKRDPGKVITTYVDPAGKARESTSGAACTELLAAAGITCSWRASTIEEGIELIRAALVPATGPVKLKISPRCKGLIKAFQDYHYPPPGSSAPADKPVKDGPDHYIDALRYFFVNRMRPKMKTLRKRY